MVRFRLSLPGALFALLLGLLAPAAVPAIPRAETAESPARLEDLRARADKGDSDAERRLGELYLNGDMVPRDLDEGVRWARASAEHGNVFGETLLAKLYLAGIGVPKDFVTAAKWYRLAAEKGHAPAQNQIGLLHQLGLGVTQDFAEALKWYRLAAKQHLAAAENNIGAIYAKGQGVAQDNVEAAKWYRAAAMRGNGIGQFNLASYYRQGLGLPKDNLLAYFWYNVAGSRLAASQQQSAARARDAVALQLTAAQVARAQQLARAWKPGQEITAIDVDPKPAIRRSRDIDHRAAESSRSRSGQARASGTGFLVSRAGHVLTNAHVAGACSALEAHRVGEPAVKAELVAQDRQNDLALIKLPIAAPQVASFRGDPGVRMGDTVVEFGFPLNGTLASDGNLTIGFVSALAGLRDDSRFMQFSAPVQPGNSGGPLVDGGGSVVGVVTGKLDAVRVAAATGDIPQNANFAIKGSVARAFLDANGIAYRLAQSQPEMRPADVGEIARGFTVLVRCWK